MGWTDERVETLKKLWLDGMSASQVAQQLGYVSRNAVIGKLTRLGISGRGRPSQPTRFAKAPKPVAVIARPSAPRRIAAPPTIPDPQSRPARISVDVTPTATVMTIQAHGCRWPIGDPREDGFGFCGRSQAAAGPYCDAHRALAWTPAKRTGNAYARSLRKYL